MTEAPALKRRERQMGMEKEVHSGKWNRLSATLFPPLAFGASSVLLLCADQMLLRLAWKRGPQLRNYLLQIGLEASLWDIFSIKD